MAKQYRTILFMLWFNNFVVSDIRQVQFKLFFPILSRSITCRKPGGVPKLKRWFLVDMHIKLGQEININTAPLSFLEHELTLYTQISVCLIKNKC